MTGEMFSTAQPLISNATGKSGYHHEMTEIWQPEYVRFAAFHLNVLNTQRAQFHGTQSDERNMMHLCTVRL